MSTRRPMGSLEETVLAYLWMVGAPTSPAEVQAGVAPELAYTTMTTVLTRLWEKGRLERQRQGRGYVYTPIRSEAEHRAEEMRINLSDAADRGAVLSSFVDALDDADLDVLRDLLNDEAT